MRKLKLQVQMTVDGQIAGPNGEMDFMVWNWDKKLIEYTQSLTDPVDCIVLGRKLAEGFIPHWAGVAKDPNHAEHLAGVKFSGTHKVVFTKTLAASIWENTILAKGGLIEEISRLKNTEGGDIIAYGGAKFVSTLIEQGLIDDFHLFVNPAAIGSGMPIFKGLASKQELRLIKATAFDCGIVVLNYEPRRA